MAITTHFTDTELKSSVVVAEGHPHHIQAGAPFKNEIIPVRFWLLSPSTHGKVSVEHPLAHLLPLNPAGEFQVRELVPQQMRLHVPLEDRKIKTKEPAALGFSYYSIAVIWRPTQDVSSDWNTNVLIKYVLSGYNSMIIGIKAVLPGTGVAAAPTRGWTLPTWVRSRCFWWW